MWAKRPEKIIEQRQQRKRGEGDFLFKEQVCIPGLYGTKTDMNMA
jgi:hypothetical protein